MGRINKYSVTIFLLIYLLSSRVSSVLPDDSSDAYTDYNSGSIEDEEDEDQDDPVKVVMEMLGEDKMNESEPEAVEGPLVRTPMGLIRGRSFDVQLRDGVRRRGGLVGGFLGIPFAEPPLAELRFMPSVPKTHWRGTLNATEFGPICFQPGEQKIWDMVEKKAGPPIMKKRKLKQYEMSEDCLTLNVYVPLIGQSPGRLPKDLPVFFYIHGGSYYMNAGRMYTGQILANSQNLIVVTHNYRLGPIGFLSTEDSVAPGNYGMLDQVLALDWVHKHIKHFGGDPDRITLIGNSAGGASVMFHMFSPLSRGKFLAVSIQSGCSGAPWAVQLKPKKHAEHLADKLNCPLKPTSKLVDCLRNATPQSIMNAAKLEDGLSLAYATVIDGKYGGEFLQDLPEKMIESNQFEHVPILTGFTRDEVTIWFTEFGPSTHTKDLRSFIQLDVMSLLEKIPTVNSANIAAMIHSVTVQYLYRQGIGENATMGKTTAVSDFISDVGLKAPCIKELNLLSSKNSKPTYLYEFNYYSVDDIKMNQQAWIGCYHESELQFIFGEPYLNYSNHLRSFDDKVMSDLMMQIWGDFVRTGSPSPNPIPLKLDENSTETNASIGLKFHWKNYSETHQDFAQIKLKSQMEKYYLTKRMLFWNFFFPIFRDYKFQFTDELKSGCADWEVLTRSWIFWALVCLTCSSLFIITALLTFRVRKRVRRRRNRFPPNSQTQTTSPILQHNHSSKLVVNNLCQSL